MDYPSCVVIYAYGANTPTGISRGTLDIAYVEGWRSWPSSSLFCVV